jgi:hypothetical protein
MADRKHENETFGPEPLLVDGRIFVSCRFNGTKLIYTGDADVSFFGCSMTNVSFDFSGAAGRTLKMLQTFYSFEASRPLVEGVMDQIRASARGTPAPHPPRGPWQS